MKITFDIQKFIEGKINESNEYIDFIETAFNDLLQMARCTDNKPFIEMMEKMEEIILEKHMKEMEAEGIEVETTEEYDKYIGVLTKDVRDIMLDTNRRIAIRICDTLDLYKKVK